MLHADFMLFWSILLPSEAQLQLAQKRVDELPTEHADFMPPEMADVPELRQLAEADMRRAKLSASCGRHATAPGRSLHTYSHGCFTLALAAVLHGAALGTAMMENGQLEAALPYYVDGLAGWRQVGRQMDVLAAIGNLVTLYLEMDNCEPALALAQEGMALAKRIPEVFLWPVSTIPQTSNI